MAKKYIAIIMCLLIYEVQAQQNTDNTRRCASTEATVSYFTKHPEQKQKFDAYQSSFNQKISSQSNYKTTSVSNYTIPVVFHILHLGGSENISDEQVIDQMKVLNIDYSKKNADTSLTLPVFKSIADSTPIRFALAKIDPNGNCTNGIIHYYDGDANWVDNSPTLYSQGWDPTKYMNVYVVKSITLGSGFNAAGYTYLPGTFNSGEMIDAIVMLNDYIGTIGTSSTGHSHVLTHEVGHWLNLSHVFGWNSCGVDCNNDDFVFDTPQTPGYLSCPTPANAQICSSGTVENYQNFMDYSYCETMFTHGQSLRMDAAAHDNIVGRDNLWSNSNLIETGIIGTLSCMPVANFNVNKTTICEGATITYTSTSQATQAGTVTWNFQGGIPASSSATLVSVTYPSAGVYSVSLIATNSNGSNLLNQPSFIKVINSWSGYTAPILHNFEDGGLPYQSNVINDNMGSVTWVNTNISGANSTNKSIYLNNISANTSGQLDVFETPIYNLNATSNVSLSYWYAYAKKYSTQADSFKLQYSLDCGGSWINVIGFTNINSMATNSGGVTSSAFYPTFAQWKQTTIPSALLVAINNKPSVKFRFYFRAGAGGSNNIYFDEINLNGTVGINELENSIGLSIYPNPTNSSATVDFNTSANENICVTVIDLLGRTIETSHQLSSTDNHITYTVNKQSNLAKGVYIIHIDINQKRISKKIIIE